MGKTFFRRTAAGISALVLAAGACSCGKDSKDESKTAAEITNAARTQKLSDADFEYVSSMYYSPEHDKLIVVAGDGDGTGVYVGGPQADSFEKLPIDMGDSDGENGKYMWYGGSDVRVAPDGTIGVLKTTEDYGDIELPDYDDPDFDYENYDWDAMYEARTVTSTLTIYDIEGNELASVDTTQEEDDDEYGYGGGGYYNSSFYVVDSEHYIMNEQTDDGGKLVCYGIDGNALGTFEVGSDKWINECGMASDGTIAATYYDDGMKLIFLNTESMTADGDEIDLTAEGVDSLNNMFAGIGETRIYLNSQKGIYAVGKDGALTEKVNWIDSGISAYDVSLCAAVAEDDFIVYNGEDNEFSKLDMIDPSEFKDTKIITLAVLYTDYQVTEMVNDFNNSHSDVRIRISDYSKYDDYEYSDDNSIPTINNTAADQLRKDIVAGNAPDMLYCYDRSVITLLENKGAFADIYPLMGKNGTVSQDEIMPNLLKALEKEGKLYSISPSFIVTTWAVKTKHCSKENWTVDDFIDTYDSVSTLKAPFEWGGSKEDVLESMIYTLSDYIDYSTGTCSFDDPSFVKLLEFCNSFPDVDPNDDIDGSTMKDEDWEAYYRDQEMKFRNDTALVAELDVSDFRRYKEVRDGQFGEDITLVGVPSSDGVGAKLRSWENFAILANSQYQDECWEFISKFFEEDFQRENYSYEVPALTKVFEEISKESMEKPYYLDENDKKVEYDDTYYIGDQEIKIDPLTQEEYDYLVDYIKSATRMNSDYPSDVYMIIYEEVMSYFNGETSAQSAADMIQNRVSILVSEQS